MRLVVFVEGAGVNGQDHELQVGTVGKPVFGSSYYPIEWINGL